MNLVAGVTLAFALMLTPKSTATVEVPNVELLEMKEVVTESVEESALPEDFEYFCQCVEAEAGDQDYLGKCYVADVILNRLEQWKLDSLTEVINQKTPKGSHYQFEVVENGRINYVKVTDETRKACREELNGRKNTEILYFCMYDWFSGWAKFCFKYGDHYFYKEKTK